MTLSHKTSERCSPYLFFVVFLAAFSGFLCGYHTGVIAGALGFLSSFFHLDRVHQGMVVSIIVMGGAVGALIAGPLADRIGRKKTLIGTSLMFILGALIISFSHSYSLLLLGRGVSGIGLGIATVVVPLYLAEISPSHYRGSFVSLFQLAITIGILCSFSVNLALASQGNWRWMFALGMFPAFFQLMFICLLPETPPWLMKHGQEKRAFEVMGRLRKDKGWIDEMDATKPPATKKSAWKLLLSPKLRFVLILGFVLSSLQQLTGINTVIYYAPKIFQTAGFTSSSAAITATLGIGTINVIATAVSVWLLDKIGRRTLLLIGPGGMAVSLAVLSFAFFSNTLSIGTIAIVSLMAYVAFYGIGLGCVTWVVLSEIYPYKVRGKAMTLAIFINWVCNYFVSFTFLDLIEGLGAYGTFLLYALLSAFTVWFVYRFLPETKGKSLQEIEKSVLR